MASKIVLDANIILDLTLQRTSDLEDLKKIYAAITSGILNGCITTSIIHICSYWMKKEIGIEATKKTILTILNDVKVIDAKHDKIVEALHSKMNDVEDALQYYLALDHNVDCFISRDENFKKSATTRLPVYYPKEFIKKFMSED